MFPGLDILTPLSLFSLLSLPSHLETWHRAPYPSSKKKEKEKEKRRKEKKKNPNPYVPLFVSKATGRRCRVLASSQPHACRVGAARCPTGTGGRLSVCQHGRWGNGVKQITLACAPMSALCAGLPLRMPGPQLRWLGDWRRTSGQAGEKHVAGGLRCQPKG